MVSGPGLTPKKQTFLSEQIQHEQSLERMSQAFGDDLLPGMYCMPHYVMPKPHSCYCYYLLRLQTTKQVVNRR